MFPLAAGYNLLVQTYSLNSCQNLDPSQLFCAGPLGIIVVGAAVTATSEHKFSS